MLRLIAFAGLIPLLIVIVWRDAPSWVILGGWIVGAALLLVGFSRGMKLNCPYCGKGVKLGATHCHHCGRDVYAEPTDSSA